MMFQRLVQHLPFELVFFGLVISIGQMTERPFVAREEHVAFDERLQGLAVVRAAFAMRHRVIELLHRLFGHLMLEQRGVGDTSFVPTFLAEEKFGGLLQLVGMTDTRAEPFVLAHVEVAFEERMAHRLALGVHVAVAEEVVQVITHDVEWAGRQDVVELHAFLFQLLADGGHQVLVVGLHRQERAVLVGIALRHRLQQHLRPRQCLGILVEDGLDVGLFETERFEPMVACALGAEERDLLEVREHRKGGVDAFGNEFEELTDAFLFAQFLLFAILVDDLVQLLVEGECFAALQEGNLQIEEQVGCTFANELILFAQAGQVFDAMGVDQRHKDQGNPSLHLKLHRLVVERIGVEVFHHAGIEALREVKGDGRKESGAYIFGDVLVEQRLMHRLAFGFGQVTAFGQLFENLVQELVAVGLGLEAFQ